jgi:hypothetical protein
LIIKEELGTHNHALDSTHDSFAFLTPRKANFSTMAAFLRHRSVTHLNTHLHTSVALSIMTTPPTLAPEPDEICGLEMGNVDEELIPLVVGHHIATSISKQQCCGAALLLLISMALNLYLVLSPFVVLAPTACTSVVRDSRTGGDNIHQDVAVVYGHVHLGKTAGTTINGELALHFERVCGNKGYSYDAYQFNKRGNASESSSVYMQPRI